MINKLRPIGVRYFKTEEEVDTFQEEITECIPSVIIFLTPFFLRIKPYNSCLTDEDGSMNILMWWVKNSLIPPNIIPENYSGLTDLIEKVIERKCEFIKKLVSDMCGSNYVIILGGVIRYSIPMK